MQILPAIDILGGRAVRLAQGRYDAVTVYNDDPVDQARAFVDAGAEIIHVVDLDGARDGVPSNIEVVEAIIAAVPVPIEVGGGIRSMETLERLYAAGVTRIVLGTTLVTRPDLVAEACARWDGIVAGVDARDGMVAIEGWRQGSGVRVDELVAELAGMGVRRVVYTDIALDGMQTGPNLDAYRALTERFDLAVIASGGVHVVGDIRALAAIPGVEGAICGRALYEGTLDLAEAISAGRGEGAPC